MENNNNNEVNICHICHRDEEHAGPMIHMPNGMNVCTDCIQKTMDTMRNMGYDPSNMMGGLGGYPFMTPTQAEEAQAVLSDEENKGDEGEDKDKKGLHNVSFINLADLQRGLGGGGGPQVKKRKPGEKTEPLVDPNKILPPHKLKEKLDEYVIGQEKAKKAISVAVYNHYKRIIAGERIEKEEGIEIEKSNMLMIGPTGCGKTYIVKTLAKILDVPLAITDATTLTEAGYIGDDIESVLSKLLQAADNDVDRAEIGIVYIDEIDKIAKKNSNRGRDVSGESVQQGLLKLLEGSEVEVPVGATSKNAMVPLTTINTKNILFICGGAFPDLEEMIKRRLTEKSSIGFMSELKDKYDNEDVISHVKTEDLREFGMIPEFLGRLPIVVTLQKLNSEMLIKVLKEPKNAILKQYQKLLELYEVELEIEDEALLALTERAEAVETGARGLRSIIEEIMLDIMYEIPKDDSIGRVVITRDYIEGKGAPKIELRMGGKAGTAISKAIAQNAQQAAADQ